LDFRIAIMPGSRLFEIKLLAEPILSACRLIKKVFPAASFVVIKAPTVRKSFLTKIFNDPGIEISEKNSYEILLSSDAAVVKSGTSTLEAGLMSTPMVVIYKFSVLTYIIGKYFLRIRKQPFGLVNILAGKPLVKELFQREVTGKSISKEIIKILSDRDYYNGMSRFLFELKKTLHTRGASVTAAEELMELL